MSGDEAEEAKDVVPDYAKSYILTKKVDISSKTMEEKRKAKEEMEAKKRAARRRSQLKRDAFQFQMLKTTLDYQAQAQGGGSHQLTSPTPPAMGAKILPRRGALARTESKQSMPLLPPYQSSKGQKIEFPRGPQKHLVKGPGAMKDYIDYVKREGYVPNPILNPEKGMDQNLYAKNQDQTSGSPTEVDSFGYTEGAGGTDEVNTRSHSRMTDNKDGGPITIPAPSTNAGFYHHPVTDGVSSTRLNAHAGTISGKYAEIMRIAEESGDNYLKIKEQLTKLRFVG